jgi:riboflavin synthase
MFTGIIQEIGTVLDATPSGGGIQFTIDAPYCSAHLDVSESVSINGVCQTVVKKGIGSFQVTAVEETLSKTTFVRLKPRAVVNLELPLQLGDRLGGHMVLGHVDCVGTIRAIVERDSSKLFEIATPDAYLRYVVPVGSIAVDGVSLTVASIEQESFTVSIIPHTADKTIFGGYTAETEVNLEFDVIGKYVERLLAVKGGTDGAPPISMDQLKAWGYLA